MVQHARHRLGGCCQFRFSNLVAQSIPFQNQSFEAVIANHMLYHIPDRVLALAEIQRVLKPGGCLYASTNGEHHLQEIGDLVGKYDPQFASWSERFSNSFTLENGATQLNAGVTQVTLHRDEDSLLVTESVPLVDYIQSGRMNISAERQPEFSRFIKLALEQSGGKLHITKDSGVFIASDPFQGC